MDTLRGRLLVATPAIEIGPFRRAIVLLLEHDLDGALGVIINRPLDAGVDDVLPDWAAYVNDPVRVFHGGPVAMDSALAVGVLKSDEAPTGWRRMCGRVGLVDLDGPVAVSDGLAGLRVFAGYAGWSPGQLEEELAEGSWMVVDAQDGDLITPQPQDLWPKVLRRQPGDLRFWATFPEDPGLN